MEGKYVYSFLLEEFWENHHYFCVRRLTEVKLAYNKTVTIRCPVGIFPIANA